MVGRPGPFLAANQPHPWASMQHVGTDANGHNGNPSSSKSPPPSLRPTQYRCPLLCRSIPSRKCPHTCRTPSLNKQIHYPGFSQCSDGLKHQVNQLPTHTVKRNTWVLFNKIKCQHHIFDSTTTTTYENILPFA